MNILYNNFLRKVNGSSLYVLKYFSFAIVSLAGIVRVSIFSYEELGVWREVASIFIIMPQVMLFGLPNYLLLRASERKAFYIFSGVTLILICVFFFVCMLLFFLGDFNSKSSYILVFFVAIELLLMNIYIKIGHIKKYILTQAGVYVLELLALIYVFIVGYEITTVFVSFWLFVRSFLTSMYLVVFCRENIIFKFLTPVFGFSVLRSSIKKSIVNNYFPMVASNFLMNFDGLYLSYFVSNKNLGLIAILVFFRSIMLIPLTLAGQKLSPVLRKTDSNVLNIYKVEVKRSIFYFMLSVMPCYVVLYIIMLLKDPFLNSYAYLTFVVLFCLVGTIVGPVHTFLQAIDKGKIAFFIDITILLILFLLIPLLAAYGLVYVFCAYLFLHMASYLVKYWLLKEFFLKVRFESFS